MPNRMEPSSSPSPSRRWQIERLVHLRKLLRQGGGNASALAEELEVTERTVRRDLAFAREHLDWPVEYDAGLRRWVLRGEPPALPAVRLTEAEVMALLVAARALEAYRGTPYGAVLGSGFEKMLSVLDTWAGLSIAGAAALPVFDLDPTREVCPRLFARLLGACAKRRTLEVTYHTLERDEISTRKLDPYHLLNHAGDWILIAYCHTRRGVRDFAVGDRMQELRETGETFVPDPTFDLNEHLRRGFSLFRGGAVEEVALRFAPAQARYIRERVWSPTETREELPDGSLVLRMRAPVNVGLRRFVLRHGAEVEVLAPPSFRAEIAAELRRAARLYDEEG